MKLYVTLATIPWQKIIAFAIMGALYFFAFYKDKTLLTKGEKEKEVNLGKRFNNRISGRFVWALIGIFFAGISLLLGYLFYES